MSNVEVSFDATFCTGIRCNRRGFCARWTRNLERAIATRGYKLSDVRMKVAEFSDHDGTCRGNHFIPAADLPPEPPQASLAGHEHRVIVLDDPSEPSESEPL